MILWKCNTLISNNDGTSSRRNRKPKRKDTKVTQPSGPTDNVVDEVVYEEMDDSLERVATTATSLDAEQDRGNINKTQSKATLNEPSSLRTSSDSGLRTELMEESSKKAEVMEESSKKAEVEIAQESSSKKAGEALEQESSKK
ncbi:hypothetical protein Tco_1015784 [Tanacetum coccineum]|uniref:Uncharacterized protein n=1 Tax=Tanacetum coccineum TaxID=301880 RepID=A0ABQ5FM95_9ASTR